MAVNLATKYSDKVDEVFRLGALTTSMAGGKYEFTGAQTVKVYSMGTAEMNDYKATGSNRYGNPEELEDTTEELTLTQKRSFQRGGFPGGYPRRGKGAPQTARPGSYSGGGRLPL